MRLRLPTRPAVPTSNPDRDEPEGILDDAPEWIRVVVYSVGAAALSASLVVTAVFAAWLASTASSVPAGQAISLGLLGWLLAHGVPLQLGRGGIGLIPWLLTLLPLLCLRWSAQRLLTGRADMRPRTRPQGWVRNDVLTLGLGFAGVYAIVAFLVAALARLPGASAHPLIAAACAFVLAALAVTWACIDLFTGRFDRLCPRILQTWRTSAPGWLRRAVAPAVRGVVVLLVIGAFAVVAVAAVGGSRIAGLYADLAPGWVGGAVLTLGQLLYLPTAAAWAVSVMAGPGFAIGTGPSVSVRAAEGGALPLVPIFGALPDPGPLPGWFACVLLVPVAVGAMVGWLAVRQTARLSSWRHRAACVAAACGLAGALMTLLFALTSGGLGSARLGDLGPSALVAGSALTGELLLGGLLALIASGVRVRRLPRTRSTGSTRPATRPTPRPNQRARSAAEPGE